MTYRPQAEFFGPPFRARLFSTAHALIAVLVLLYVFAAERGWAGSGAHHYLFRERHPIDPYLAAGAFAFSALMNVMRDSMRGVAVKPGFLEYRELLSGFWPRVRRYRWAQIDQVTFEASGSISVDLWNGSKEFLPPVRESQGLREVIIHLAAARAIPVHSPYAEQFVSDLSEESIR